MSDCFVRRATLLLILGLLLLGCAPVEPLKPTQSVGKLIRLKHINGGWGQDIETRVTTTKGTFMVIGDTSGFTGAEVTISGHGYMHIAGTPYASRVEGFNREDR